jgi:hypothetical protein
MHAFATVRVDGMAVALQSKLPTGPENNFGEGSTMDLTVWLPAMFVLGLAGMGLMFAFIVACDHV